MFIIQLTIFVPVYTARQLLIAQIIPRNTCSCVLPLLPAPCRKLAACVALPILSIPGIAILSGGAAAHMRALLAHTYGLQLAAHIAFVQLEAVVALTCGDRCVVSA